VSLHSKHHLVLKSCFFGYKVSQQVPVHVQEVHDLAFTGRAKIGTITSARIVTAKIAVRAFLIETLSKEKPSFDIFPPLYLMRHCFGKFHYLI